MSPFRVGAVALALASCRAPPSSPPAEVSAPALAESASPDPLGPPPPAVAPHLTWHVVSAGARANFQQSARSLNDCTVQCQVGADEAWRRDECVALDTDLVFVSDDCSFAVVLKEYPHRAESLPQTVVGAVVTSAHTTVMLLENVTTGTGVDVHGQYVRWLDGVLNSPGARPKISADGLSIELTLADHHPRAWPLASFAAFSNGSPLVLPSPEMPVASTGATTPQVVSEGDPNAMYSYLDGEGSTQVVQGLARVPSKYRKQAQPIEAEIEKTEAVDTREMAQSAHEMNSARVTANPLPSYQYAAPATPTSVTAPTGIFGMPGLPGHVVQGKFYPSSQGGIIDNEGNVHYGRVNISDLNK